MTSSGVTGYNLSNSDVLIEAFDRIEVRPAALTAEHFISGRRSLNLELTSGWDSNVPLLWKIDATPTLIPLQQGVSVYNLPTDTVTMLDTYIRTFQLPNQFNVTPSFTTVLNSNIVTANIANTGLLPGYWFKIATPVAVGGILLFGFYEVISVLGGTFTFAAATNATSGTTGGVLPQFTSATLSTLVTVTLANHGLVAGQSFNVAVATTVGGIYLLGSYIVSSVTSSSVFVIQTNTQASSAVSVFENSGMVQIQGQSNTIDPIDRILTPIGRTDYAEFPDKFTQTIPTQYLFLRNINPTVTLYQVPDGNGPYVLSTYLMRRIQNANLGMDETPDVHFLFLDALCAKLAVRLAVKYAKSMLPVLKQEAQEAWMLAIGENQEHAENYIVPNLAPYFRM